MRMVARVHSASRAIVAGFAVLSFAVAAGFVVGYCARPASAPDPAQLSASQNIERRFPDDWRELAASSPGDAFASTRRCGFSRLRSYPISPNPRQSTRRPRTSRLQCLMQGRKRMASGSQSSMPAPSNAARMPCSANLRSRA